MSNATGFDFDALNRRTAVKYPGGVNETFTYDKNSNIKVHTDGNGVLISHDYDELNREILKSYSASADGLVSIATAYDANNNVKTVTQTGNAVQVSIYSYDEFDREQLSKDPFGASANKTYDANGNKTADYPGRESHDLCLRCAEPS
ncbi:hypothetical protein LP420_39975 [Massilia sp. B-10]|nr:hypothetical protein LP420_39975 [Massilia sp. B-10]